jgi:hypothetical protein
MTKTTYTIRREGQFYANLEPCDQCGGGAGQKTFRFEVALTVDELDHHGFSIDNRHVPDAFNGWEKGAWYGSCEDLAAGGLLHLHAAAAGRATAIAVRIIANGDSSIQVDWQRGQELPTRHPHQTTDSLRRTEREEAALLA